MKTCRLCQTTKDDSEFHRRTLNRDGICNFCKPCMLSRNNAYAARNRGRRAAKDRERNYGVSPAEYQSMLEGQVGECAICRSALSPPHVDHDHRTGAVRGLLCHACNKMLGYARDRKDILLAAVSYLNSQLVTSHVPRSRRLQATE